MKTSLSTTAFALVIAVSAAACKKDGQDAGAISSEWKHVSADGRFEIVQTLSSNAGGTPTCEVKAFTRPDSTVIWTGKACIPAPSDLVFFSAGGEKLLILNLFPAAGVQSPDWSDISLAQLWVKGKVERQYKGAELLAADRATDMRRSFSWLRGDSLEEVQGSARAVASGTQLSLDLADGRTITLGFEGAAPPKPPAVSPRARPTEIAVAPDVPPASSAQEEPAEPPPAAGPVGLADGEIYRWEDDSGEVHFTTGATVPAKYMRRARPLRGAVGVVPMEAANPVVTSPQGQTGASAQPGQPAQPQPGAEPAPAPASGGSAAPQPR